MSNKYHLKNITFYTLSGIISVNMNDQVFYNSPLPEIPSCPPGTQMNLPFPLLNTSYTISSKSLPTASMNHPLPPKTPVSKHFISVGFTPAKVSGALRSIPQVPRASSCYPTTVPITHLTSTLVRICLRETCWHRTAQM